MSTNQPKTRKKGGPKRGSKGALKLALLNLRLVTGIIEAELKEKKPCKQRVWIAEGDLYAASSWIKVFLGPRATSERV